MAAVPKPIYEVNRSDFGRALGLFALAPALFGCAAGRSARNLGGLEGLNKAKVARNMGMFRYAAVPTELIDQVTWLHVFWSPSCRDSMRFYRFALKPIITRLKTTAVQLVFVVVPRTDTDLAITTYMRSFSIKDYWRLAIAQLEVGAHQDRFLTMADTQRIAEFLNLTPEKEGDYDANLAKRLGASVNDWIRSAIELPQTPILFLDGKQITTEGAKQFLSSYL